MTLNTSQTIEATLRDAFQPEHLSVVDESHLHAGHHHGESDHHAAFDGSGGTHFRVSVTSARFAGLTRIQRHRAVNEALAGALAGGVHALAIEALAPGEPRRDRRSAAAQD